MKNKVEVVRNLLRNLVTDIVNSLGMVPDSVARGITRLVVENPSRDVFIYGVTNEATSVISDIKFNLAVDHWDDTSDSYCNYALRPNKRARYFESNVASNANVNMTITKFKGVVPQQNGRWGAQVYAHHQRIWLGTFKSEKEAAMAYDSALIKLRSKHFHRNFSWNNRSIQEPSFQNHYTKEAVLNMIKDGSYESKFEDYLRSLSRNK
ncbi:hypothetical protein ACFE04_007241 [Oxalis oulophora]